MACLVAGRTLLGHVRRQLCALLPPPGRSSPWQPGGRPLRRRTFGRWPLPGLPLAGPLRKRHRLDLPRSRLSVDAHRHDRRLRRLRSGPARLCSFSGGGRGDKQLAVGARRGSLGNLPATALPRRQASIEEMAPSCVALCSVTRIGERRCHALAWTVGEPRGVHNPFGLDGQHWLRSAGYVVLPLLPLCMLASALSLVLRFRRSGGEERQQIKWIAFSASVVVIVYLIAMVASLLSPAETWFAGGSPAWLGLLQTAALLSLTAVPVAVAFAVLRYRLYEIDILINRTLVYGSLTATLALAYVGGVVVLQTMVRAISGQKSSLAVVASTLAIAA